jgi:hypothetical protein
VILTLLNFFRPQSPALSGDLCGRELCGLFIEGDTVRFRFSDNSAVVLNLESRVFSHATARLWKEWFSFPGWLRITGVKELPNEISISVAGAIYSSRVCLKRHGDHWQVSFGSGQVF